MKSLLYYLLQVIICSGILYSYYHFFLRNKKFHLYNRYYLLVSIFLSILIPFLNIPVYFTDSPEKTSVIFQTLSIISPGHVNQPMQVYSERISHTPIFTVENILKALYLSVASFIFLRFFIAIFKIKKLFHKYVAERIDHIYFINTQESGTPFSFFKWLFWNKKIELKSEEGQQIFRHELFHIEQKHSWDIVFIEIASAVFWINPFIYFIRKEIKTVHEFLADRFAVNENNKWEYAELLLMQSLNTQQRLVNPFFHNQIKRRIVMITSSTKPEYQFFRKLMILPVIFLVLLLFAFKVKSYSDKTKLDRPVKTVMNASNNIVPAGIERYVSNADTTKPGTKQKSKKDELRNESERKNIEAEEEQKEFKELMEEKQLEAEKSQTEFKQLMIEKELEAEKAQMEFKQLMQMKQIEAEKAQTEFKQMMMVNQQEAEKAQIEFKKMMENKQQVATPQDQEKFRQLIAEKQREYEKLQGEFKQRMMENQQEAEKFQMEFNLRMEKTHQEMEMIQDEFKKNMLEQQREMEEKLKENKKAKS